MSENVETQLAVMKTDISYIKKAMDIMTSDMKELKGAYVPYTMFVSAKADSDKIHETFVTKDQFKSVQDRVRSLWTGAMTIVSIIVLAILGALINLVLRK